MLKISPLFHALLKKLLDAWKVEIIKIKSRRQASISKRTNFFSTILLRLPWTVLEFANHTLFHSLISLTQLTTTIHKLIFLFIFNMLRSFTNTQNVKVV